MNTKQCACGCGKKILKTSTWAKGHNPNKAKDRHDWSNLESDYQTLRSTVKVAEKYGCTHEAVSYQMKKRGITPFEQKIEIDNVLDLYEEYKSAIKVAKLVGCSVTTVKQLMREKGHLFNHDNKGLDREVGLERYGERIAGYLLKGSEDLNATSIHAPYDFVWSGMNIDVKTSRKRKRANGKSQFTFTARNKSCTHYLLIALNENDMPIKLFLIPRDRVSGVTISYTEGTLSKWNEFALDISDAELNDAFKFARNIISSKNSGRDIDATV